MQFFSDLSCCGYVPINYYKMIRKNSKRHRGDWTIASTPALMLCKRGKIPNMLNLYDNGYIPVDYFSSVLSAELTELEYLSNFLCVFKIELL